MKHLITKLALQFKKAFQNLSRFYPFIFVSSFIILIFQYSFPSIEAVFYDFRIKYDFGIKQSPETVLVIMDEESDEFLGEKYPYTYSSHLKAMEKIAKDGPAIINYFVSFLPPENIEESTSLSKFKDKINDYKNSGGGFRFATDVDTWGEQLPPSALADTGHSLAIINVDNASFSKDDISRRAVLTISGENSLHLWTANKYREIKKRPPIVNKDIWGAYYLREADALFFLFRYAVNPHDKNSVVKSIPFHRVLVGNFPEGYFKNKIVLVGSAFTSNANDFALTPFSKDEIKVPKLFIHSQIINSLIQEKTVLQVSKTISFLFCLFISIILSIYILKNNPSHGLVITVSVMGVVFFISYFVFCIFGVWIYLTQIILTIFATYYIWVPFRAIEEYQQRFAIEEESKILKQVESLKQNFISLMSHDLKTPVARIAGIVDVLMRFDIQENAKIELKKITDSTKELNKFITSILDLTKIESRNLSLNLVSKDINMVIKSVIDDLHHDASLKDIKIKDDLSPLYPIQIDIVLIKRVISNLVENAIKYSGSGTEIYLKSWDDAQSVYVQIDDTGIGIPEEDIRHIFDKFYRVLNDNTHAIKGSGLGLYLVKYFVELHGATITANSKIGEGTSFLITFKNR